MTVEELKQRIAQVLSLKVPCSTDDKVMLELFRSCVAHIEEQEKELADERKYSEGLASDICKMEDVLGFKQDQHDKDGAFVPTIGPWLERVRDLLANEGELGDLKDKLTAAETKLERAKRVVENGPKTLDAKWLDPECWDGCQSLVYKNKLTAAEQRIEQLSREAGQMREALEHFQDKLKRHPKLFGYELEMLDNALSTTAGNDYIRREELRQTVALLHKLTDMHPFALNATGRACVVELTRLESLLNQKP